MASTRHPSPEEEGYKEFLDPTHRGEGFDKRITGNVHKESFKNSSVLLLRRRWDEANEKVFLKLSETVLYGRDALK